MQTALLTVELAVIVNFLYFGRKRIEGKIFYKNQFKNIFFYLFNKILGYFITFTPSMEET